MVRQRNRFPHPGFGHGDVSLAGHGAWTGRAESHTNRCDCVDSRAGANRISGRFQSRSKWKCDRGQFATEVCTLRNPPKNHPMDEELQNALSSLQRTLDGYKAQQRALELKIERVRIAIQQIRGIAGSETPPASMESHVESHAISVVR